MNSKYNKNEALPWEEESKPGIKIKIKTPLIIALCVFFALALIIYGALYTFSLVTSAPVSTDSNPLVLSVEQLDAYPVSQYEVDSEIMLCNYGDRLETDFSSIGYKYKVTLDNGREFVVSPGARVHDIGSSGAFLEVNGYIYINDLGEIIKSSDNTVNVTVSAKIRNAKSKYNPIISEFTAAFEKEISDCIVQDLRYESTTPISAYYMCDNLIIQAGEFEITYGDGRKVIAKPKMSDYSTYQTLDGHYMNTWTNDTDEDGTDDTICVAIADCPTSYEIPLTQKGYPFDAVEITDCSFDESYKITSLSYTVTYKDGTVKEFTDQKTLPEQARHWIMRNTDSFEVSPLHGYYVIAEPEFVFPEQEEKAKIKVTLTVGFISDEQVVTTKVFTAPESDCECICHNNGKTEKKFYSVFKAILEFLSLKEYCKCGIYHYEISAF